MAGGRANRFVAAYLAAGGLILLALGWIAVVRDSDAAAAALFVLGGGALLAAPFASRLEGTVRFGPVEFTVRQQVISAARSADEDSLEGVLPLISGSDAAVRTMTVPTPFGGHRLTDDELGFLRQKLDVSVVAVLPRDEEAWHAGGAVSRMALHAGDQMLVAGHRDVVAWLAMIVARDDEQLRGMMHGSDPDPPVVGGA